MQDDQGPDAPDATGSEPTEVDLPDAGDTPAELFEHIPDELEQIEYQLFDGDSFEESPVNDGLQGEVDLEGESGCFAPTSFGCAAAVVIIAGAALTMIVAVLLLFGQFANTVPQEALNAPPAVPASPTGDTATTLASPTTTTAPQPPTTTADPESGPVLVPLAGTWSFADGDGTMDCGTLSVPIFATQPQLGQMEVLEDGTRLRVTSSDPDRGVIEATFQPGETAEGSEYEGAMDPSSLGDIPDGGAVNLIFTATFDSQTHATTKVGGTIESAGTTCTIERTGGEATRVGD